MISKVKKSKELTLDRVLPCIFIIGGIIGFLAAFILTVEKIELIKDPSFVPSCNLSPLLSCGSVMKTWQSEAFGFPNSLIGIAGFSLVVCVGAALLAGAQFKRWFWRCVQAAMLLGIGFIFWLQYQSIYVIGALCPYCMVVWTVMIPLFWYTTLYNLREGHIPVTDRLKGLIDLLQRNHASVLLVWFTLIIGLILNRFWYYWETLL